MFAKGQAREVVRVVLGPQPLSSINAKFWIETIALVSAIACALALVIATLGAVAGAAAGGPESGQSSSLHSHTYEGMITDTHCGAKHSAAMGQTAADCTRFCVRAGEGFVLVDGDRIYLLEGDLPGLKRGAGQRVKIVGALNGNKISVASVGASI
jgi:uncharacterized low-complexity protein